MADHQFGSIEPNVAYALEDFKRRAGMGTYAIRQARRKKSNPLIVRRAGRRAFVLGSDFIEYLKHHGVDVMAANNN